MIPCVARKEPPKNGIGFLKKEKKKKRRPTGNMYETIITILFLNPMLCCYYINSIRQDFLFTLVGSTFRDDGDRRGGNGAT